MGDEPLVRIPDDRGGAGCRIVANCDRPSSEAVARELAPLSDDEEQILETWREAQADAERLGTRVTAKVVKNAVAKRLALAQHERDADELKTRRYECRDCEAKGEPGVPFVNATCDVCRGERARLDKLERKAWWDSLSETKREEHVEQAAQSEAWHQLRGPLEGITGENSIAEFVRNISDEIKSIELWRQPGMTRQLIDEVSELVRVATDLSSWLVEFDPGDDS